MAALDLLKGCWGYDAGKPLIMFLLALTYALFGTNPSLEIILLVVTAGLMAGSLFLLARKVLPGTGWALAVTIWFISWPTTIYYMRIHLGYGLALFVGSLAASAHHRNFLSGLLLGLSILAHPGLAVPAAIWLAATTLSRQRSLKHKILTVAGIAITIILLEIIRYFYTGEPLGWLQGQLTDVRAYGSNASRTRWSHVLEAFWLVNGEIHSMLCVVGITAYVLTMRSSTHSSANSVFITGLAVLTLYTLRTGTGIAGFNTRLMLGANPLLAITAMAGLARTTRAWSWLPSLPTRILLSAMLFVIAASGFANARHFSHSAYPALEQAFLQAKALSVPLRYFGQPYAALFFGVKHNVETLANATNFTSTPLDNPPAVIVVESQSPSETRGVTHTLSTTDSVEYDYQSFAHPAISSRLRNIEEAFFLSTKKMWQLAYTPIPEKPTIEIWVPRNPASVPPASYADSGQVSYEWLSYYYHGDGICQIVPREHPYAWRYYRYLFPRLQQLFN